MDRVVLELGGVGQRVAGRVAAPAARLEAVAPRVDDVLDSTPRRLV